MRTPTDIISETLNETDVRPMIGALQTDIEKLGESMAHMERTITEFEAKLGPVMIQSRDAGPPCGAKDSVGASTPEPERCGISNLLMGLRRRVQERTEQATVVTAWLATLKDEVRL